jgi:hypothetical protein
MTAGPTTWTDIITAHLSFFMDLCLPHMVGLGLFGMIFGLLNHYQVTIMVAAPLLWLLCLGASPTVTQQRERHSAAQALHRRAHRVVNLPNQLCSSSTDPTLHWRRVPNVSCVGAIISPEGEIIATKVLRRGLMNDRRPNLQKSKVNQIMITIVASSMATTPFTQQQIIETALIQAIKFSRSVNKNARFNVICDITIS